jgi:hypothetical protein
MKSEKKRKLFKSLLKSGDIFIQFPKDDQACLLHICEGIMLLERVESSMPEYVFMPEKLHPRDCCCRECVAERAAE